VRRILSRDKKLSAEEGGPSLREEELQRLIDAIPDALWSAEVAADGALAYRYCSPAVLRITGLSPEHLMASSKRWLGTIIDPLDRAAHAEAWQRITSGATNSEQAQYRIRRADGTLRWLHDSMRATRLHDGRLLLDGVASDITEAKRAEEALRESEARFRGLTELSSDWYWRQDETLRFTYLSNQALDLTGHTGHSSYGKTRWELANMVPLTTTWPEHQAVLARSLQGLPRHRPQHHREQAHRRRTARAPGLARPGARRGPRRGLPLADRPQRRGHPFVCRAGCDPSTGARLAAK
jgi:PAS domain S-box-containing protein